MENNNMASRLRIYIEGTQRGYAIGSEDTLTGKRVFETYVHAGPGSSAVEYDRAYNRAKSIADNLRRADIARQTARSVADYDSFGHWSAEGAS